MLELVRLSLDLYRQPCELWERTERNVESSERLWKELSGTCWKYVETEDVIMYQLISLSRTRIHSDVRGRSAKTSGIGLETVSPNSLNIMRRLSMKMYKRLRRKSIAKFR